MIIIISSSYYYPSAGRFAFIEKKMMSIPLVQGTVVFHSVFFVVTSKLIPVKVCRFPFLSASLSPIPLYELYEYTPD